MGETYNTKELPQFLRDCLKAIGYRKHKAIVTLVTGCEVYGTNWSGGSRNEYYSFDHNGKYLRQHHQGGSWMRPEPTTIELLSDRPLVIQAGTFCGKPGTAFIYIHPRFAQSIGLPVSYTFSTDELEDWSK